MIPTQTPEAPATKLRAPRKQRKPREKLTHEQRELASKYMPLARRLARPVKLCWPIYKAEIDSAACYAVVEAAQAYDPGRGVKFATFARMRVLGAIHDARRKIHAKPVEKQLPNIPRAYRYIPGPEESATLMMQSYEPDVSVDIDAIEQVEVWLRALPTRHAAICREIYLNHLSQAEVAKRCGYAKSRICCIHAEAIQLLRELSCVQAAALDYGMDVCRN
jgi:RNA polymerase sigma factor (sigma-70 family)